MGKGINDSTLRANRENKRLGKEGRSPMGEPVAQKELSGAPEYSGCSSGYSG